jgi:phage terminase large subunit
VTAEKLKTLTEEQRYELLHHLLQKERERVTPKMEQFRKPARIKVAYGGRGAGAKSWGIASLLVQKAHRENLRIACLREIQLSLEESVHSLIGKTIDRLRYPGWHITDNHIDSPAGSHFIFRGLKDLRAAQQIKGLEGYDIFWLEEAATISHESINALMPTLRKDGSELWVSFNREQELDPVYERFVLHQREDSIIIWLEPGRIDNEWFTDAMLAEMEEDYKRDPDEAMHIWGGLPRPHGKNTALKRSEIIQAARRNIEFIGQKQIGVDVARFGDDETTIYSRTGLKTTEVKKFRGQDTMKTAYEAWDLANHDKSIPILVDVTGVGAGVVDRLQELGAKVIPIDFGGKADENDLYANTITEMFFQFREVLKEADIPEDSELISQLSGRKYGYDNKNRYIVESKEQYKKRLGRSPDDADGILLCYYNPKSKIVSKDIQKEMAARRRR